jgi:hypothetical protein
MHCLTDRSLGRSIERPESPKAAVQGLPGDESRDETGVAGGLGSSHAGSGWLAMGKKHE